MSQVILNQYEGLTRVGVESSFATASGNMKALEVVAPGNALGKPKRAMLDVKDQRRNRHDHPQPVAGLSNASPVTFSVYLKALASILDGSATPHPYSDAAALSQQPVLQHWMGGEVTPAAGSIIISSADSTHITVSTGQGSRFTVGAFVGVTTSLGIEPRRVVGIATDTLQLFPPLLGTPVTPTGVVRNSYTYFLARTHTGTMTVETAYSEPGVSSPSRVTQRRALGVHGSVDLSMKRGEIPTFAFQGEAVSHTDPGELSIDVSPTVDDMGAPMVFDPQTMLGSLTLPAEAVLDELSVKIPARWTKVPGHGTNGVAQVVRTNAQDTPIEVGFRVLFDAAQWAAFDASTLEHLLLWTSVGTGSAQRIFGIHVPRFAITEEPQEEAMDNVVAVTVKGRAFQDTTIQAAPAPGATTDVVLSNVLAFLL